MLKTCKLINLTYCKESREKMIDDIVRLDYKTCD